MANAVPAQEWEREVETRTAPLTTAGEDKVISWRRYELERAGYEKQYAELLAERVDVDLHRACELLRQGCAEPVALEILL